MRLDRIYNLEDMRLAARRRLPRVVFDFIDGGADDEVTLRENRAAYERVRFHPRVLAAGSSRDLSTSVFACPLSMPVMLGPAGLSACAHPDGDLAVARAAEELGTKYVASIGGSYDLEAVAAVTSPPRWFQLYLWRDRILTDAMVGRAEQAGYDVLCLTVDAPVSGRKERNLRNRAPVPPALRGWRRAGVIRHPVWGWRSRHSPQGFANLDGIEAGDAAFATFFDRALHRSDQSWADVEELRRRWPGRLVLKGILTPGDALRAVGAGVDGIVVSNHGGRQLDFTPSPIEVLPAIRAVVGDSLEVLVDSGLRRGTDVVKALALGARACLIVRPWYFALGVAGQEGVEHMLGILRDEIDRVVALLGRTSVAQLDESVVGRSAP